MALGRRPPVPKLRLLWHVGRGHCETPRMMTSAGEPAVSVVADMADHGAPVQLPSLLRTVLSAVPPQVWFCEDGLTVIQIMFVILLPPI